MPPSFFGCQVAAQPSAAMIRISTGIRNSNLRAVVNCLLVRNLPSSSLSSVDYTSSSIALGERKDNLHISDRRRNPAVIPPVIAPRLDVSAGGGPRPKTPRVWKTKSKRGSVAKSEKLVDLVNKLSNTKEEVYGALDAWIAWDLEFPLIAVKKALKTLKDLEEWRRIIQVSKWMLDKGQGKTLATYQLLLQAFDHEGRIEEAEVLWEKVLRDNMECIPRTMFSQVIGMLDRYGKKKELLKVYADMEEFQVRPDPGTMQKVAQAYAHYGYEEHGKTLLEKYSQPAVEYRYSKGKRVPVRKQHVEDKPNSVEAKQGLALHTNSELQTEGRRNLETKYLQKETPRLEIDSEFKESPRFRTDSVTESVV